MFKPLQMKYSIPTSNQIAIPVLKIDVSEMSWSFFHFFFNVDYTKMFVYKFYFLFWF